jgi:hypothetical protein
VTLMLLILGALVFYRLAVLCWWICAWLAIQPLRLALFVAGAMFAPRREASPPVLPSNVVAVHSSKLPRPPTWVENFPPTNHGD